jgi:membrane fusion protein (multidrug efflux system)
MLIVNNCLNTESLAVRGGMMESLGNFPVSPWSGGSAFRSFCSVVACLVILLAIGCHKEEKSTASSAPIAVTVNEIVARDTPVTFEYVAQTQSSRLVNIYARVSGFLDRQVYTEGSMVKEGQVLFMMDQKPFQVQLDQAEAALARQEAAFEVARANLARTKPLVTLNALSQRDLDDATGQFESAAAAVEEAKSQVETAKLNLSYCTITSPVAGITSAAIQTEGTYLNPQNSQLTTVAVLTPMWVNFSLSENEMQGYYDQVSKGFLRPPANGNYEVEVILVDGSLFPHTGRITFAAPSFNSLTGTFLIRASVDNPEGKLRPNQYVRVRLKGAVRPSAVHIPQRAVQQGPKGHFVWVVDKESKAELRPVVAGDWYENDWFILEGLRTAERVVVDGGMTLRPGISVTVQTSSAKPDSKPAGMRPQAEAAKGDSARGGK